MTHEPPSSKSGSDHHHELPTCHDHDPNQLLLRLQQDPAPSPLLVHPSFPAPLLPREQKDGALKREEPILMENPKEKDKAYRQGNWILSEILILLEAKAKEQQQMANNNNNSEGGGGGGVDKWKEVSEYCKSKGVNRTKEQCKVKWDNMMPDFRKVRDYEEKNSKMMMRGSSSSSGGRSYFELEGWERRARMLPSNMDMDVYQRIANILVLQQSNNNNNNRSSCSRRRRNQGCGGGLKREAREKSKIKKKKKKKKERFIISENTMSTSSINVTTTAAPASASESRGGHDSSSTEEEEEEEEEEDDDDDDDEDTSTIPMVLYKNGAFPNDAFFSSPPTTITNFNMNGTSSQGLSNNINAIFERPPSAAQHEPASGPLSHDMLNHIENRKDARHKEWMALEREKLAVFKQSSLAIANAMTKATSTFSKVAEELILRQGKGT